MHAQQDYCALSTGTAFSTFLDTGKNKKQQEHIPHSCCFFNILLKTDC